MPKDDDDDKDAKKKKEGEITVKKKHAKHAGFNHTEIRVMRQEIVGEGSPGPGAYSPLVGFGRSASAPRSSKKGKPTGPSTLSSFRSTSMQRPKAPAAWVPGPGQYAPSFKSIEANKTNPGTGMTSKSQRGKDLHQTDGSGHVGPGAYDSQNHRSLTESLNEVKKKIGKSKAGFGSTSTRLLPHEKSIDDVEKWYRNMSPEQVKKYDESMAKIAQRDVMQTGASRKDK